MQGKKETQSFAVVDLAKYPKGSKASEEAVKVIKKTSFEAFGYLLPITK